ncbi:glutamate racemase [Limosilactobacillus sp.]|uniref:glutamate racemase n=1 Tax=Limosilactobacillus sp. TaxID=2773925 RepID=UPI00345EE616
MDQRPIGVMDSGLGGLSVVRLMRQRMPHESVIFVGDQGHFPYGTRTQDEVRSFALTIGKFLVRQNIKLMVIACNTATAASLTLLQDKLPVPVIGVIRPGAEAAVSLPYHDRIGVIATESTTKDGAYVRTIKSLSPQTTVVAKATQPLVPIVEHGQTGTPKAQHAVDKELALFKQHPVDGLILGCTHFPFLTKEIMNTLGKSVAIIDPAGETVQLASRILTKHDALAPQDQQGQLTLYSTGTASDLAKGARQWLGDSNLTGEHLALF